MPAYSTTADTYSLSSSIQDLIDRPPVQRAKKHSRAAAPSSTITVPIPLSSLLTPEEIARLDGCKEPCEDKLWITRLLGRNKGKKRQGDLGNGGGEGRVGVEAGRGLFGRGKERVKDVRMSRAEYEAYWARDEDGNNVATEPEWKGRERLRERLCGELGLAGRVPGQGGGRDRYT